MLVFVEALLDADAIVSGFLLPQLFVDPSSFRYIVDMLFNFGRGVRRIKGQTWVSIWGSRFEMSLRGWLGGGMENLVVA